ncbi:MAG: RDD family protein [Candidatus Kapaibacterium sp.]
MSTDLPIGYNGMEPAEIPIEEKRVGFGKRFGAVIIDGIIVLLLSVIIGMALSSTIDPFVDELVTKQLEEMPSGTELPEFMNTFMHYSVMFGVVGSALGFVYSLMELLTGASVGKMILGIVVAQENGKRGNIAVWGVRWILKQGSGILSFIGTVLAMKMLSNFSGLIGLVYLVGCFFVLGVKRQAFHDMIAKTAVFEKEDITE